MNHSVFPHEYVNGNKKNSTDPLQIDKETVMTQPKRSSFNQHISPIVIPFSTEFTSDAESDCESISVGTLDFCNKEFNALNNKKLYSNSELRKPALAPSTLELNIPMVKKVSETISKTTYSKEGFRHAKDNQGLQMVSDEGKAKDSICHQGLLASALVPIIKFDGMATDKWPHQSNQTKSCFKTFEYFNHLQSKQKYLNDQRNKVDNNISDNVNGPDISNNSTTPAVKHIQFPQLFSQHFSALKPAEIKKRWLSKAIKIRRNDSKNSLCFPTSILASPKSPLQDKHPTENTIKKVLTNFPGLQNDETLLPSGTLIPEDDCNVKLQESKAVIPKVYDPKSCFQLPHRSVLKVNVPMIGSDRFSCEQSLLPLADVVKAADAPEVVKKNEHAFGTHVISNERERPTKRVKNMERQRVRRNPLASDIALKYSTEVKPKEKIDKEKPSKNKDDNDNGKDHSFADKERLDNDCSNCLNNQVVTMVSLTRDSLSNG